MQVAQTILDQLGGGRFIAMTGARAFVGSPDTLRFRVPRTADGATVVEVKLTPADLYDVTCFKVRGIVAQPVRFHAGVYAEDLRRAFEDLTGYRTSL